MRRRIGIGLVGFGWMGQAHSRSYRRLPMLFPDREADPELVICSDTVAERREDAVAAFGYSEATGDWRKSEITRDELVQQMSGGAELEALEHELQRVLHDGPAAR